MNIPPVAAIAAPLLAAFLASSAQVAHAAEGTDPPGPERWETDIAAFDEQNSAGAVPSGGIVFIGSSSIRRWDLGESWPGLDAVNRGFGGSLLTDTVHFLERIAGPLAPRALVVYAGDNDFSRGSSIGEVVASFEALAAKRRTAFPEVPLVFVAIKPSVKRWELWPAMVEANAAIAALCGEDPKLHFADIAAPMLDGAEGAPAEKWFAADGLHLSPEGYELWASVVSQALREAGAVQ